MGFCIPCSVKRQKEGIARRAEKQQKSLGI